MFRKLMFLFAALALLLTSLHVDVGYDKKSPLGFLWGNPAYIHWDPVRHVWINENPVGELWRLGNTELTKPEEVPVKKTYTVTVRWDLWKQEERYILAVFIGAISSNTRRGRFVLINVEENGETGEQYKVWPHLGILAVGTVAEQEGYEVVLWDELDQGHADLEALVGPGDIVGLSMVVSSMHRGIMLAAEAKALGARCVIAGNDGALFRARQILAWPKKPIDAVLTSNSTNALREFLRQLGAGAEIAAIHIPDIATRPEAVVVRSNEPEVMASETVARTANKKLGVFDPMDGFIVPKLELFSRDYWEKVWGMYRSQFGHKHRRPDQVRNALVHLAQGCTRTQGKDACSYCTIYGIGDLRLPDRSYLEKTLATYKDFGINTYFNVTDSALEMRALAERIAETGVKPEAMVIYGRAQGLARHPEFIDAWMATVNDRLLINCGMDSGDAELLRVGIRKSSTVAGSMADENRLAIQHVRAAGAHLHFSLIFGSPGESVGSCERSMEFLEWASQTLGSQLDVAESDIFWLNFGSPAARVFRDYGYARSLAHMAGKDISAEVWARAFARYAEELVVPRESQVAWYTYFTHISIDIADDYNRRAYALMERHPDRVRARYYAFKDPNA